MPQGFVYIIYSESWGRYYVDSTQDIETRLEQHNSGRNKSTKGGVPWILKYSESFDEIAYARRRELELKKKKSRKYLEWLISSAG
ncbi:GIY-YIG nuclease family protein [Owenweeksia hongkongensis]|uniref:GIY-YIG nuclease family protein n=1 Tax=Owenweeksia hongkongensis TaxID=253245 RepID=UPI0005A1747A|nr:GIY-YIG nuclease family protein [Owenweeksia hongkongensis]